MVITIYSQLYDDYHIFIIKNYETFIERYEFGGEE
jgi:hypothetical protein